MAKLLITGASGQLGGYLVEEATRLGHDVTGWAGRREVDLSDAAALRKAFRAAAPDVVIHAAALSSIKESLENPELARVVNIEATGILAEACKAARARFVYISTDMVYDGDRSPYEESARTVPKTKYGQSKLAGEKAALAAHPESAVLRLSLMIGLTASGRPTFFGDQVASLKAGKETRAFVDEFRSVMTYDAAARCIVDVAAADFSGILNVAGPDRLSRYDATRIAARLLGLDETLVIPIPQVSVVGPEPRPKDLALDVKKLHGLFPNSAPKPLGPESVLSLATRTA